MEELFIVQVRISSSNHVVSREEIDESTDLVLYKYNKETRQAINAVRNRHKYHIFKDTIDFHRLRICSLRQQAGIQARVADAAHDLNQIHDELGAKVVFVPLDVVQIGQGALYGEIVDALKYKVFREIFKKLEKVILDNNNQVGPQTKKILRTMLDRVEKLNILEDEDVAAKVAEIRQRIENDDIVALKGELDSDLRVLKGRFRALEL